MTDRSPAIAVDDRRCTNPEWAWDPESIVGEPLLRTVVVRNRWDAIVAGSITRRQALVLGFPRQDASAVEIVAAELATNIAEHAGEGRIGLHGLAGRLVLLAFDEGPGIGDPRIARADRYSRGRKLDADSGWWAGMGCGLGAVHRLMDDVEIRSVPGRGTCVVAHKSVHHRA